MALTSCAIKKALICHTSISSIGNALSKSDPHWPTNGGGVCIHWPTLYPVQQPTLQTTVLTTSFGLDANQYSHLKDISTNHESEAVYLVLTLHNTAPW